jgi:hypothetical protein
MSWVCREASLEFRRLGGSYAVGFRRAKRGEAITVATVPATTAQNGAPILAIDIPESVMRKVKMAASRRSSSFVALARLAPMVGSSARAAMMWTSSEGNALRRR